MCTDPLDQPNEEALETANPAHPADDTLSGGSDIAIIGMTGRFPGATTLADFWDNLCAGRHAITFFEKEELRAAGVPEEMLALPQYVRASGTLDGCDLFDAGFFGMSPSEAEVIDPQHRLFLEMAWQVLEDAGYDPFQYPGAIGLFAGSGPATYLMNNLAPNIQQLGQRMGLQQILIGNDKDFMPLRVAYKLDLRGPTMNVQSACSTSLVAVHMGCQSLINGECDLVLAGGIRISSPVKAGYMYQEGQIASPDGLCRAFDAQAEGTVGGSGGGLVALKMLNQAIEDGDRILAVIKGSAVNNDGKDKISFTAPSVEGQAAAIREAMAVGNIDPETVTFVETHGTATPIGDPIEIAALRQAFGDTEQTAFCALTSTKANIGHLDAGAGVAGLIKAAMVLQKKQIPPSAHFEKPNPKIPFENGPFFVNQELRDWQRTDPTQPLRAGVSSFGMGGTNAHVVLEEAAAKDPSDPAKPWLIFPISAKTTSALDQRIADLQGWLEDFDGNLADLAFTLQQGRAAFAHRTAVVAGDQATLANALANPAKLKRDYVETTDRPLIFLFTGQGSQQINMGRDLYETEAVFRETLDFCAEQLLDLGFGEGIALVDENGTVTETLDDVLDLRDVLYPTPRGEARAQQLMRQTAVAQVALFTFEYALASLWLEWGLAPEAMIGHSLGEYVAATLAEVMTPEDALFLIEQRGRLMQGLEAGAMLAVRKDAAEIKPYLSDQVSLAVVNSAGQSVLSGTIPAINALEATLNQDQVTFRRLETSHAFHSPMMSPILEAFAETLAELDLQEPTLRYVSNLTGTWIEPEQATSPEYWCRHLRETVQFHAGLESLLEEPSSVFLEIGPGKTLTNLVKRHPLREKHQPVIASVAKASGETSATAQVLSALGELWKTGIAPDWYAFHQGEKRYRLALPTYPFQRQRFWIEAPKQNDLPVAMQETALETPQTNQAYERPELHTAFAAPETEQEQQIAAIWGDLLAIKDIGRDDDFLDLGGDSIVITQIHGRLRETFALDLPLQPLFELNTIAEQAAWIADLEASGQHAISQNDQTVAELLPAAREGILPLSFAQKRLWVLDKIEGSNPAYHMPAVLVLEGELNHAALEATFTEIARRHEIMRTAFPDNDGIPHQVICDPEPVTIEIHQRETLGSTPSQPQLAQDIAAFIGKPFDLATAPCFRVALFRLAPQEHVLAVVQHHIISDGWSISVLVQELAALYPAALEKQPLESLLPPLPVQYADFAVWQRSWLEGEAWTRQMSYWQEKLAGLPPHIELPTDRPHPPLQTFAGAIESLVFEDALSQQIRDFAKTANATLFMVLKAAFAALMHRYSHQQDIAIGTPIANRTRKELEPMVGCFINTLVLRASFEDDPDFTSLVARTRQTAHEAYAHQDIPFEEIVETIQPQRDLSRNPLFQVMFVLQNTPPSDLSLPHLQIKPFSERGHFAKFEIQVDVHDLGDTFACHFEYNTDLFDAETIERMAQHFQSLTRALIHNPGVPVSEIAFLESEERERMLTTWNNTHQDFASSGYLLEPFDRWATQDPQRPALTLAETGETLTYGEFHQRAEALAFHLNQLGVGPETLVGVYSHRSLEMVIALYGIVKAGAAYVPIDPNYPSDRVAYMLEDSAAPVIITSEKLVEDLSQSQARTICLDAELGSILERYQAEGCPELTAVHASFHPARSAYMIYTSGSTGKPKGAINSHQAICNRLDWIENTHKLTRSDHLLQKTPFSFDVSVWEFFWPLRCGARLVIAEPGRHGDANYLAETIQAHAITTMHFVPSMLHAFLSGTSLEGCQNLRQVFASGEALSVELALRFQAALPQTALYNLYGPTEAAIEVTYHACHAHEGGHGVPIGKPIANTQIYLVDPNNRTVPQGVSGELLIGGINLARGYHRRPGLTAERFIPHAHGQRVYRSGDLARHLPNGEVIYQGRIDHQVKLRGFRIELGEIEAALLTLESVRQAVALVQSKGQDQRLIAFLEGEDGQALDKKVVALKDATTLRNHLSQHLPNHMIPGAFVVLDAFPVTTNGKLDRRRLQTAEVVIEAKQQHYEPPRTANEKVLAEIWTDLLPVEAVGIHDNFFELGGDSILAIQIISLARGAGLSFTPKDLFEFPTIAQLASQVKEAVAIVAEQGVVTGDLPLTPVQQWFFGQQRQHPHHFNQSLLFAIDGGTDPQRFSQAVEAVVAHHDALRLQFTPEGESWRQENASLPQEPPFEFHDLTALEPEAQAQALEATCQQLQASHRLDAGVLIRVGLFRLTPGENPKSDRLFLSVHHLAVDGVSWRILLEDLLGGYAMSAAQAIQLPPKTSAYRHWAQHLDTFAQSEELAKEIDFWQDGLTQQAGFKPMPDDRAALGYGEQPLASLNVGASKKIVSVTLEQAETQQLLVDAPSAYNTQVNDLLLSALAMAYQKWTDSNQLWVDLEGHGREDLFPELDISRTVGWFTTIFPVHLKVDPEGDLGATLMDNKEHLRAIPQRGIGYGLLRYLRQNADCAEVKSAQPADILFNYLGQLDTVLDPDSPWEIAPENKGAETHMSDRRSHLFEINAMVTGGSLRINFEYSSYVHRAETVAQFAEGFIKALQALVAHCLLPETGAKTPSDFPHTKLSTKDLRHLLGSGQDVTDLFPLTPMQSGMLFHAIYAPSSAYHQQFSAILGGSFQEAAFLEAWTKLLNRHGNLRSRFFPEDPEFSLQAVMNQATIPFETADWRDLSETAQLEKLEAYLVADRQRGFALDQAPLMRFAMFRIREDRYRFILSNHHLLMDGWSIPIVLQELFMFYEDAVSQLGLTLPPPASYRNYITWLNQQDLAGAKTFWQETLAGFHAPTPLAMQRRTPLANPGQAHRSIDDYGDVNLELSLEMTQAVQAFVQKHHLTVNTVMQAAWAYLLGLYAGEQDVVFGATVSGRPPEVLDVERIVGMFINTLPVRIQIPQDGELLPWLQQVQKDHITREAYAYSPLVEIQRWSDIDPAQPLFETLVVFENYPLDKSDGEGESQKQTLWLQDYDYVEQTNFPLVLTVNTRTTIDLTLIYDRDRFETSVMDILMDRFQRLLLAMTQAPEHINALTLLSPAEQQVSLVDWNQTQRDFDLDRGIHQLFERQAEKTPGARALRTETADGLRDATYEQLNQRAEALAQHLRALGAGPDVTIGMACERSFEMMVALLGILKAGAAYVPMDPKFPADRLAWMVEDSGLNLLLTRAEIPQTVAELITQEHTELQVIRLDSAGVVLDLDLPDYIPPTTNFCADALAYVIYTSGSTGKPKGVQLSHRAVINFLSTMAEKPGLSADDVLLAVTTISFDIAGLELYLPLMIGAQVVLASSETAADSTQLAALLQESQATVMQATPATWQMLVADDWSGNESLKILCGGEALPSALAEKLLDRCDSLWNMYGPTETTIWSTILKLDRQACSAANLSIGHPIGNTTAYVLDQTGNPVPIGIPGHLHLGGQGLARGYRNRPALTAEKFIPDAFADQPGARLYATGDQVRYQDGSQLVYLGRFDHQIKLRGFRIELGEIEAVLERQPGVQKAVALVREDRPGDQRLVAYMVAEEGSVPDQTSLRSAMAEKLPVYMLPSALVELDEFPMTPNRKINRRALPAPVLQETGEATPLRNPTQELVASVWSDVLDLDSLGSEAHFFALGGHSLLAAQVIARLRKRLKIELPISALFEAPTVASFSQRVAQAIADPDASQPELITQPREGAGPWRFPLSTAQQQLWLFQQITDDSTPYHMPFTLRIDGPLDVDALETAFQTLIERHESLRTTFESEDGRGVQVIHPVAPWQLETEDLSNLMVAEQEAAITTLATKHASERFDLTQGPLFRVQLLKLSPEQHLVLLNQHHIISDAWSLGNLATEITALYTNFAKQLPNPLPKLPMQYADFSVWQQQWFQSGLSQSLTDYWRQQLGDLPNLQPLPLAKPRPETATLAPGVAYFQISETLVEGMRDLGHEEGATVFMVLLATLNALTAFHTQSDDVVIGTDVANRDLQEQEPLIGFFVNQIILRTQLHTTTTFKELLTLTRETVLQGYAHQQLPFDQVVSMVNPDRRPHINPLFQMKLVLQNVPVKAKTVEDLTFTPLHQERGLAKFDLLWNMEERDGRIFCDMQFNQDLYSERICTKLGRHLIHLLGQVVQHPELPLASIQFLLERFDTEQEKQSQADLKSTRAKLLKKAKRRRR